MTTIHINTSKTEFNIQGKVSFEVAPYELNIDPNRHWFRFRVGTMEGIWSSTEGYYNILAFNNTEKHNGHLIDTLQWFEQSCIRDKKKLRVLECWNKKFKQHLINKQGFIDIGNNNVEKQFI